MDEARHVVDGEKDALNSGSAELISVERVAGSKCHLDLLLLPHQTTVS